ncbi:Autophagy-related protein 9 [Candida viswanathii]|uniref:Autophagy-related protein 9 n=1 Tax=Candida viswanathii TaxID=5486 RepID=A0A367XWP6_9ASCO|nr:Autophagy-related protein 9 [Candida viswanathii]
MSSTSHNPYKDNGNTNTSTRRTPMNMSTSSSQDYTQNAPSNNDTFLSRIFGLNSIYNQLEENYRYYDPEVDSAYQQQQQSRQDFPDDVDDEDESLLPHQQNIPMSIINDATTPGSDNVDGGNGGKKKANSLLNSDSDSDLSSSEDSYVRPNPPVPAPPQSPGNQKIKFLIPQRAKSLVGKLKHPEPTLPMYQTPQQFRRQPNQRLQQQQAQLQASNSNYRRSNNNKNRFVIPPKERALYLWANITNMDEFLSDVYYYYRGKGLLNMVLTRTVDLVILVFILLFTVFLKWGINYSLFFNNLHDTDSKSITLSDLVIPYSERNIPIFIKFLLFGFSVYIVLRVVQLYFDYNYKLKEVKNFYHYLLNVSDDELMTISWKTIVERLMLLKDYNSLTSTSNAKSGPHAENHYINDLSSKVRLNAHDIANRIMRRENYMIALINKDVLDLSVLFMNEKSVLTKTLEWNLKLCIDNFIYNQQGQINGKILKEYNRNHLARDLTSRFKLAALINLILSPFIVIYFVLLYFFRYFNEYKSNPASIVGLRQYTPYAEWKLREFNELPHFFTKRLVMSMGPANTYIDQFPKGFLVINTMKLANFVSGSILAVLVIMGILLEDESHSFWSFEITEGRSALFYILIFGTIWAITSSSVSESPHDFSNQPSATSPTFVYDPETSLRYVAQYTHYLPASWNKKLHTIQVKNEFCELYSLKIIIILHEILSLVLTPYILWAKVSQNSGAIIDFFREYSIHVDGLGYVCYFAMFNFEEKDKNMMIGNKKKNKRKYQKQPMRKSVGAGNETPKISKSDLERSDDDRSDDDRSDGSDEALDYLSTIHDQKMINLYIHFHENYNEGKRVTNNKPVERETMPTADQQSLNSSIYDINYKFDDSGILKDDMNASTSRRKGGVLGMLNQFYKQDINRQ